MATANISTFNHRETDSAIRPDGFCMSSAMFGGATGALVGASAAGSFEYGTVLVGTLGVVLGSVIAGAAGHYVIFPVYRTFFGRWN